MHSSLENSSKNRSVVSALVGPPNAGKTTLYNWLTGAHFSTVNYPGSTVEYSLGKTLDVYGDPLTAIDTPGIYSLHPRSPEEEVTISALFKNRHGTNPKVVIAVVDSTQMQRHLFLVKQLQEAGFSVVVALTMMDLAKERGLKIEVQKLSQILDVPVVPIDGRLGGGVKELVEAVRTRPFRDPAQPLGSWNAEKIESIYRDLKKLTETVIQRADQKKVLTVDENSKKLDRWLLHPALGLFFFVAIMGGLFSSIFWAAQPMMDFIDGSFASAGDWILELAPGALWSDFVARGVIAGAGSVLVFVPQIFILFIALVLLEDWGYLARAAALIDRPMSKIGLNGRSFVPLLSGYACAIPAMMAARTISSRRERLLTLFIVPLMSCSARLPVYALLLAFLFQGRPAWEPGLALAGLYAGSLVLGAIAASIAGRMLKLNEKSWFMLELPTYRQPVFKNVLRTAGRRTWAYIKKAGPAILVLSLFIWVGTTFPSYGLEDEARRLSESYAAMAGRAIEPVMEPMGADWRIGVSLIAAFAAREVFVSALALIFNVTETEDEESLQNSLLSSMKEATSGQGTPLFTTASVIGLIVFFMIALQCLSTVVVSRKESGSLKFAIIQVVAFTGAAYLITVVLVQGLRAVGVS